MIRYSFTCINGIVSYNAAVDLKVFSPLFSFNQEELDHKLFEVLGEKTEADEKKPMNKKKEKPSKTEVLLHNKSNE